MSTGAIVGATLGGVAGVVIIVGLIVFLVLRKRRRARKSPEVAEHMASGPSGPSEVQSKQLHEMGPGTAVYKRDAAVEVEQPAAELEGTEITRGDDEWRTSHTQHT